MSNKFTLNAEVRETKGKGSSRRLRRLEGKIPAIIYGGKGKEPANITLLHKELVKSTENEAFFSHIITLNIGKKEEQVIIKDLQRHPAKLQFLHADFLRVDSDVAITVHVPLHYINEEDCDGVKLQGGVVSHTLIEAEVSCLPADLPEYIEVDMIDVEMDQIIHLSDLKLPNGVQLVALTHGEGHDLPVAAIHAPKRVIETTEDEAAPADADAAEESGDEASE